MTNQIQISTIASNSDFKVNMATGEAYISQRKLATELGIHHSSLQTHLSTRHPNLLFSEGIPSNILQETAIHFAYKSKAANTTAESFTAKLMEAGAKAYLYHEAGIPLGVATQRASFDVAQRKLELYEPVLQQEVAAYKLRIEAAHKIAMEDIAQRRIALEQREYVLIDGMQVKIDMEASKVALPIVTITAIVAGSGFKPHDANMALLALGYLEPNPNKGDRFMVSREGSYYGRNVKTSKDANVINARWFEGTAKELLEKIKEFFEAAD